MARLIQYLVEPPHPCAYLADREAQLEIKLQIEVSREELEAMIERGWRRFGPVYFRPACASCTECVTLRVDARAFKPSKSQRRALKNAAGLVRTVQAPIVDDERIDLYHRWHAHREEARGWEESGLDKERYSNDFAFPHPAVREVAFRTAEGKLVGLGIVDDMPQSLSAVYFFWDPELAPASLGVAHVAHLVLDAQRSNRPWVYLGYRVQDCPSLVYKSKYRPHELLSGRPLDTEIPSWSLNREESPSPEDPEPK